MGFKRIVKRDERVVPFEPEKITWSIYAAAKSTGGFKRDMALLPYDLNLELYPQYLHLREKQIAESLTSRVISCLEKQTVKLPKVEQVQNAVEKVLADQAFIDVWEAYRLYRWSRTAVRKGEITEEQFSESGLPDEKCREIEKWNKKHHCHTMSALNELVKEPKAYKNLIESCIQVYTTELDNILAAYLKNPSRIIFIAGPSSSGKTTTTKKTIERLEKEGCKCKLWPLDMYFKGVDTIRPDKFGDYNYEVPEALDDPLIHDHFHQLFEGKEIIVPRYNFGIKSGKREGTSGKMRLEKGEILVVDSLYAISPKIFPKKILPEKAFIIYIETLNMVRNSEGRKVKLTDNRLLRRMIRDIRPISEGGREYPAEHTLGHWHYVRNGELGDLIPYMNTADYIINGGLAFELPILKEKLHHLIPDLEQFRKQKRFDAFIRGHRIKKLFDELESASDKYVPKDCHLREFIGGLKLR